MVSAEFQRQLDELRKDWSHDMFHEDDEEDAFRPFCVLSKLIQETDTSYKAAEITLDRSEL